MVIGVSDLSCQYGSSRPDGVLRSSSLSGARRAAALRTRTRICWLMSASKHFWDETFRSWSLVRGRV
jgi:hypothetical protein